jgi:uncharacterized protein (DUF2249 family)/hemerythrin-like domain-containing protein
MNQRELDAMTITQTEALDAMYRHHHLLNEGVDTRIAALNEAVHNHVAYEPAVASLVVYLAEEVLPHALAEEQSIYRAARTCANLTDTVDLMIAEHRVLASAIDSLAGTATASAALDQAQQIGTLFTSHVAKENEVLLPALLQDVDVDLTKLLKEMHRLPEEAQGTAPEQDASTIDSTAAVLSLLLEAARELARGGKGDRACQLVALAWTSLRTSRPDLAAKTTASLHGLARLAVSEPVALRSRLAPSDTTPDRELDVRHLAPAQRHEVIFASYFDLAPGTGYVLINDHDPKPLRYQFEAEHTDEFTWDSLESGPEVWRVRIAKVAVNEGPTGSSKDLVGPTDEVVDVRVLPHGQRHEIIFATFNELVPNGGFVLVNDHDPKPLHYQFDAQYAGEFTWDYLESGPELWRLRIGKTVTKTIN